MRRAGALKLALLTSREIGDRPREARALGNLANVLAYSGHHYAAQDHHNDALRLASGIGDRMTEFLMLNNLGVDSLSLGHLTGDVPTWNKVWA